MPADAVVIEPSAKHLASVIWLHGLGADGHDFEPIVPELGLPDASGVRFIFPNAPVRPVTINGGMIMRAWYDIREPDVSQQEDAESIAESAGVLHEYVEAEFAAGIQSERILVAGFSQGGAIALYGGLRCGRPLAGILALSCYLPLADRLADEANPANLSTPILMMHGTMDPVIPVVRGQASRDQLVLAGYDVHWRDYPMPHSVCLEQIADIGRWLRERLPGG